MKACFNVFGDDFTHEWRPHLQQLTGTESSLLDIMNVNPKAIPIQVRLEEFLDESDPIDTGTFAVKNR